VNSALGEANSARELQVQNAGLRKQAFRWNAYSCDWSMMGYPCSFQSIIPPDKWDTCE
jgi:hypothetical protein